MLKITKEIIEHYVDLDGIRLCYFESGREYQEEGTYLLVHATGFHARCWDRTIDYLGERHVVAMDIRGHGRSDKTGPYTWDVFGRDLQNFITALDLNNIVGAGHSMGGHSVTLAASMFPWRFARLVLIDPVIMAPESYRGSEYIHQDWLDEDGGHPVARRRNFFRDARDMFENFVGREPFSLWREDVLRDYCNFGLLPDPLGDGYVLACPPTIEASVYMGNASTDIHQQIEKVELPVVVLRARQDTSDRTVMNFSRSPTWDQLAGEFKRGTDVYLPEMTHFIPMQDPQLTARYLAGDTPVRYGAR